MKPIFLAASVIAALGCLSAADRIESSTFVATHPTRFLPLHYHCRDGMHTLTPEDWAQYMDFAAAHGW